MSTSRLLSVSLAFGLVLSALALYLGYDLHQSRARVFRSAEEGARSQAVNAAAEIDSELNRIALVIDQLAKEISAAEATDEELRARVVGLVESGDGFLSAGVAYGPSPSEQMTGWSGVEFVGGGESVELRSHARGDDAQVGPNCYATAIGGSIGWGEPFYDEFHGVTLAVYSTRLRPVSPEEPETRDSVVFGCVALDVFAQRVAALDVGRTGWGFVVSKGGSVVVHPDERVSRSRINVFELAKTENDQNLLAVAERIRGGEGGIVEMDNRTTGQSSWFAYEPIPSAGWSMVVVRIKDEVAVDHQMLRRRTIWISATAVIGLTCLGLWFAVGSYIKNPTRAKLWAFVLFTSVLMIGGMAAIRHVTYEQVTEDPRERIEVVDKTGLQSFLNSITDGSDGVHRRRVPSGIFIRELKFGEPRELFVKGILWQRIANEGPQSDFVPGFVLPDAHDVRIAEAYRYSDGHSETIGWEFQATVRQDMTQSRFPFDHELLAIRLLPTSFDGSTVLVPDLGSYLAINPAALPGLDENLVLPGWHLSRAFFDYKITNYNTDFGLGRIRSTQPIPELHFNIAVKRNLVDAAVGYGIPLLIVVIMLFAIVATATKDEAESMLAGFSPSAVMRICSALFFVVLLAHIQLRQTVQVSQIVFLEYIYFTVYLALLLTTLHTFLLSLKRFQVPLVEYEDSLIIKLSFWPGLLGIQFLITVIFFY